MKKEEYLNKYKEEKLAELCEELELERNKYKEEATLAREYKEAFDNINALYNRLILLQADDFVKLFYKMKDMMDGKKEYTVSNGYHNCTGIVSSSKL